MTVNWDKYEQAILYFLHECDNRHLGVVKLMKLLYYLDFDHYEQHGVSITGDTYKHEKLGPVGEYAGFTLGRLKRRNAIVAAPRKLGPYTQDRHNPLVPYNLSVFDANEIETLRACDFAYVSMY